MHDPDPSHPCELRAQAGALRLHGLLAHWAEVAAQPEQARWVSQLLAWEGAERGRRSLGLNTKEKPIAEADEVPAECGVMVATGTGLEIVRVAPKQPFSGLRFDVWMALAKAAPLPRSDENPQMTF
jgi:hypothetical protein